MRRVTPGHYDALIQELMRQSRGDFKSYLRFEPEMFREMLDRVAQRVALFFNCFAIVVLDVTFTRPL